MYSPLQIMFAIMLAVARVGVIVLLARLVYAPEKYTWVQALVIVLLAVVCFAPISVGQNF